MNCGRELSLFEHTYVCWSVLFVLALAAVSIIEPACYIIFICYYIITSSTGFKHCENTECHHPVTSGFFITDHCYPVLSLSIHPDHPAKCHYHNSSGPNCCNKYSNSGGGQRKGPHQSTEQPKQSTQERGEEDIA